MPSEMKVNKISPASGTAITLGDSGDTFTVPSGVTLSGAGTSLTALNATQLTSGTIPIARIADDAVTNAKMADDAIGVAQLSATGTASGSTFLRGDNVWAAAGGGKILQVLSSTKTDTFSDTNGTTYSDITGLSIAITPAATTSKILVAWNVAISTSAHSNNVYIRIMRASTAIARGDAAGSRQRNAGGGFHEDPAAITTIAGTHLDSPSTTSATTYKVQIGSQGSITKYVNRGGWDNDVSYAIGRTASTITVMEIGA